MAVGPRSAGSDTNQNYAFAGTVQDQQPHPEVAGERQHQACQHCHPHHGEERTSDTGRDRPWRGQRAHEWHYRALEIDHHAISFMNSPNGRKPAMLRRCLSVRMDLQHSRDTLANLFWDIDPVGEYSFQSIIEVLENADAEQAAKVGDVVRRARRPAEYIYGELRRLSSWLPEGSRAKTIIDRWWDLAEERRRNAPAPPNFEPFSDWPEE